MSIYHLTVKRISRGKGQSAIAKGAYNGRDELLDQRTGETKDYSDRDGVKFSGIFAPPDAPEWMRRREDLWNAAELAEKRKDALLAIEIEVALPHELDDRQREWLVKDFVREQFSRKGIIADVNIHEPDLEGDNRNHHAHILLALRTAEPEGFGKRAFDSNPQQVEQWREQWLSRGFGLAFPQRDRSLESRGDKAAVSAAK
jgi:MobA/MobL family